MSDFTFLESDLIRTLKSVNKTLLRIARNSDRHDEIHSLAIAARKIIRDELAYAKEHGGSQGPIEEEPYDDLLFVADLQSGGAQ